MTSRLTAILDLPAMGKSVLITTLLAATTFFPVQTDAAPTNAGATRTSSTYNLVADYTGGAFFDAFDTFITNATVTDPTDGSINYVSMPEAISSKMVGVVYNSSSRSSSLSYVGVDLSGPKRNSVRLESKFTFGVNTLLVADIHHMPVGCGLWPAFWALGQGATWPAAGEIDVVEAVHNDDFNHVTLHTSPDCAVDYSPVLFQGNLSTTDCNAGNGADGCSVATRPFVPGTFLPSRAPYANTSSPPSSSTLATAGAAFNAQGGAVYALLWTSQAISIYIFAHSALPTDLAAGHPSPENWTTRPLVHFRPGTAADGGAECDFTRRFADMRLILNTEVCGSWAGADDVWESSGCKARTGQATCDAFVAQAAERDEAFDEAYWLIDGIKVFSVGTSGG
nr:putative endo-1,3(4)-beta-glucanase [Quercus suber]